VTFFEKIENHHLAC